MRVLPDRQIGQWTPAALLCTLVLFSCAWAARAEAKPPYAPPADKIWHGVSDTGRVPDFKRFNDQVRSHNALNIVFYHWGVPLSNALERWKKMDARGVLSLSTAPGGQPEVISPRGISRGRDDEYPLRLWRAIRNSNQVVYVRPFGEMNLHYNPYSAFNADGSRRAGHSTHAFKLAWKRIALILRGGRRAALNKKLRDLGMPRMLRANRNDSPVYDRHDVPKVLDPTKVAFVWTPLTRGSPNVPGNTPGAYFPGRKYVDWVGTDVYSKFSNQTLWTNLNSFFDRYNGFPFMLAEYGAWDNDHDGSFTRRIHRWARGHRRVRALLYYRSVNTENVFNLQYYDGARHSLRKILNRNRYAPFAPNTKD
ncbi:MAG: hypothetical protein M3Y34_01065 [Actinomycetota bacterium]|nr:hypothetical protein [Actinomycetota bacterium]